MLKISFVIISEESVFVKINFLFLGKYFQWGDPQ